MAAYATADDLDGVVDPVPGNADQLLARASRQVDQALLTAVYDPTDPAVVQALKEATVEQVAAMVAGGDRTGLGGTASAGSFTIGRLSVQNASSSAPPTTGVLASAAWAVLQAAGLTGHAPGEAW